jgi:hypothetical protein
MTLDTNLSTKPYFDDYDVTKNFYRVLYRPSVAVQARELNQMQTIMQDQIEKFGRNIFKDGSVVEGCSFTFDNNYTYVKIKDTFANGAAIPSLSSFVNTVAYNQQTIPLKASIVNTISGYESDGTYLNTLYLKYLNSTTLPSGLLQSSFSNGDVISVCTNDGANTLLGQVTVATIVGSTGKGYAFTTTSGTIFKKGVFISVAPQTLVVSQYNNVPDNISVGFDAIETIITPEIDATLVDNAAGSPNYSAPGAHRLKMTPTLITRVTNDTSNSASFFSVCDFKNGLPVSIKNDPQYAAIGADMARRTFETNGDYVVNPFVLSVQNKTDISGNANTKYLSLVSSPGVGYVKGYRVEFINNNLVDLRKGNDPTKGDVESISSQIVSTNFGFYFQVNQCSGDFNNNLIAKIELHNTAKQSITNRTFLSTGYDSSTQIGTAYCRGVAYAGSSGIADPLYNIYVFNIQMNAGRTVSDVRSLVYYSGNLKAVADVQLTYDANLQTNVAKLFDSVNEIMIHPFGQKAIKYDGFSATSFVYRDKATSQFLTSGILTINLPSASGTGGSPATTEAFNIQSSLFTAAQKQDLIVIPTQTGYSSKTGTVTTYTTNTLVLGVSTTFASDYVVGDFIYFITTGETKKITSVVNNTILYVDSNYVVAAVANTHKKAFVNGVPINFGTIQTRTANTTTNVLKLNLAETADSAFNATVYYSVLRANSYPIKKVINKNAFVKINVGTNTTGPWSLGLPDVLKLNHVYVGSGTYSASNPDKLASFGLDSGQRDAFYGLATISTGSPLAPNSTLLVSFDVFSFDEGQGHGFFTAGSYPIDDINLSNVNAIETSKIPVFISRNTGSSVDLRDVVDFRPYANATANIVFSATDVNITTTPSSALTIWVDPTLGSYLPTPDGTFITNIQHYLPRKDRVALTTSGSMIVTEGVPANIPSAPLEIPGTMTIGIVDVPAYPALTPADAAATARYDYAVQITMQQTKRYTMADIGRISKRIDRLEYYTSLSLLEKSASSLLVRSSSTGQNRFQNGILVDPFSDHSIGNTNNPSYRIAIDSAKNEARPFFTTQKVGLMFDSAASTAVKTGSMVSLPYSASVYQRQSFASKYHNCIEGNVYKFRGTVTLNPPGSVDPDITQNPSVIGSIDTSTNWVNLANYINTAWGTSWGAWSTGSTTSTSSQSDATPNIVTQNPDGTVSLNFQSQVTTTTTQQLSRTGQQLVASSANPSSPSVISLGNYVTNINISPFMKATTVFFKGVGLKPATPLYAYFNNVPVNNYCMPLTPYIGTVTVVNGIPTSTNNKPVATDPSGVLYEYVSGNWNGTLFADSAGMVYGAFQIPQAKFNAGDIEFRLTDISNLSQGESAITTDASGIYHAIPLSIQKNESRLQVFDAVVNSQEVTDTKSVQQQSTSTSNYVLALSNASGVPITLRESGFNGAEVNINAMSGDRLGKGSTETTTDGDYFGSSSPV